MSKEEIEKIVNPIFSKYQNVSKAFKHETILFLLKGTELLKQKSLVYDYDKLILEIDKQIEIHQKRFATASKPSINWIPVNEISPLEQKERALLENESTVKYLKELKKYSKKIFYPSINRDQLESNEEIIFNFNPIIPILQTDSIKLLSKTEKPYWIGRTKGDKWKISVICDLLIEKGIIKNTPPLKVREAFANQFGIAVTNRTLRKKIDYLDSVRKDFKSLLIYHFSSFSSIRK